MRIRKVAVIGCGLVGSGVSLVTAQAGYEVVFLDRTQRCLDGGLARIRSSLQSRVEKGRMDNGQVKDVLSRITGTTEWEDLAACDIFIECVDEDLAVKKAVFENIDFYAPVHALVATSTSSLCVSELAAVLSRPDRTIGLHFACPVPAMMFVELVEAHCSSKESMSAAREFAESVTRTVILSKDSPGFVVNRLLVPYLMEAIRALETGVASKEDIDEGARKGLGYPLGPFEVLDLVGLDIAYLMSQRLFEETRHARYAPPRLLKEMVVSGFLGRKTGRGFYKYR
ncbi:MAG: 3-hydroxyacyl-CoA dehydrogenase family protein [Candidatus Eisenbacteria sp.]|nr:3-hydroxyacyl-CoA dehydrogenase family protein [Candidatus Eisenbacteria bacterium]